MKINVTDRAGNQRVLECTPGDRLMEVLLTLDLVEATCGGECSCATCQVYVADGWIDRLPAQGAFEAELLDELLNARSTSRLACQIALSEDMDGLTVTVAQHE